LNPNYEGIHGGDEFLTDPVRIENAGNPHQATDLKHNADDMDGARL